jgi:hypothetical protein
MAALTARADGEATTVTTTMATAAQPPGTTAPEAPPDAGVAQLRGIMVMAAPTAPEGVPLIGAVAPGMPRDSGGARPRGITAPALTTGLTAVRAPGADDRQCQYQCQLAYFVRYSVVSSSLLSLYAMLSTIRALEPPLFTAELSPPNSISLRDLCGMPSSFRVVLAPAASLFTADLSPPPIPIPLCDLRDLCTMLSFPHWPLTTAH